MGLTQQLENDRLVRGGALSLPTIINPQDLLKYLAEKPQRMAKDMVDKIIDTTIGTTVDKVKRLVKRTKPVKKQTLKGGMNREQAITNIVINRRCNIKRAERFLADYKLKMTDNTKQLLEAFDIWNAEHAEPKPPKKKKPTPEVPSEGKEGKEEAAPPPPPLVISVDDPALPPGPPPAPAPGPVPRLVPNTFRLSEKEFDNIKNTKPRLEYRRILKDFFNELSITSWGGLPGNFVSDINNLGLRSGSRAEAIDKLRSTLSSYKTLLSKREPGKETTIKIKSAEAKKKTKKVPKKRPPPVPKRGAVRKIPAVKRPPKRPTKAKKAKKAKKGKGSACSKKNSSISVLI